MKYNLIKLSRENDLNRELRRQKRDRSEISILFVSPWDKYCNKLLKKLERENKNSPHTAQPLYIVDSYNMPHSFVIFKSSMLPQFVNIKRSKVYSEDYLPFVYRNLGLE